MKRTRERTIKMLNTIGMSESILKLIERRTKGDMLIFCLLVAGTLLFMYILYFWVKPLVGLGGAVAEAVVEQKQM
jgi:hypothetical protein